MRLGDVLTLEYGKPLPSDLRASAGTVPVYGANGIKDWTNSAFRNEPTIIVGRKGSAGEIQLADGPFWPLDVTYFVEFDRGRHDLRFLYYLLDWIDLRRLAKGIKPGVNRNEAYDIPVSVPPLEQQRRVVAVLDEAFAAISTATANAEKNLANGRELFERCLSDVFERKGPDWIIEPLKTNVRFIDYRGKTPPKREAGIRLITAKNVKMGFIQRQPEEFVDPAAYDSWMTRGFPQRGDVLFTTEAPLGNVAQLDTDEIVVIGQRLITMQPNEDRLDRTFLKYMLCSAPLQRLILRQATGATVSGIKAKLLKEIPVCYPRQMSEQLEIVERLDALQGHARSLAGSVKAKIEALENLKQSLLHSAFSGKLNVREPIAA
jgi:type I restriction enzyme S subunit